MQDDLKVQRKVREILNNDKNLRNYNLHADVVQGKILLQGVVDTLADKQQAARLLQQIPGVQDVENAVAISTDGAIREEDVYKEVEEELKIDPRVDLYHVGIGNVDSKGTVILKGHTDNPEQINAAIEAASKARGVTRVINQVETGSEELSLKDIFHSQVNNDKD
ncbi:BON domain-containing protein [Bacillota bacterium LX-D]|nr:BON domain-containing protein [Bacillota bacterium LX-D]